VGFESFFMGGLVMTGKYGKRKAINKNQLFSNPAAAKINPLPPAVHIPLKKLPANSPHLG
jgi:hypothetical protein